MVYTIEASQSMEGGSLSFAPPRCKKHDTTGEVDAMIGFIVIVMVVSAAFTVMVSEVQKGSPSRDKTK